MCSQLIQEWRKREVRYAIGTPWESSARISNFVSAVTINSFLVYIYYIFYWWYTYVWYSLNTLKKYPSGWLLWTVKFPFNSSKRIVTNKIANVAYGMHTRQFIGNTAGNIKTKNELAPNGTDWFHSIHTYLNTVRYLRKGYTVCL